MSDHKIIAFIEKIKREYNSVLAITMQCLGSGTTEFVRFGHSFTRIRDKVAKYQLQYFDQSYSVLKTHVSNVDSRVKKRNYLEVIKT